MGALYGWLGYLLMEWSEKWPTPLQIGCVAVQVIGGIALMLWLIWR